MTFLGPYDGKQSLYGEILDVFCKKSEHWLPTGVPYFSSAIKHANHVSELAKIDPMLFELAETALQFIKMPFVETIIWLIVENVF